MHNIHIRKILQRTQKAFHDVFYTGKSKLFFRGNVTKQFSSLQQLQNKINRVFAFMYLLQLHYIRMLQHLHYINLIYQTFLSLTLRKQIFLAECLNRKFLFCLLILHQINPGERSFPDHFNCIKSSVEI